MTKNHADYLIISKFYEVKFFFVTNMKFLKCENMKVEQLVINTNVDILAYDRTTAFGVGCASPPNQPNHPDLTNLSIPT